MQKKDFDPYVNYEKLLSYHKIIVYGAGSMGKSFLEVLMGKGFDKSKIEVWDIRHSEIGSLLGIRVDEPDFTAKCSDASSAIIIALASENAHIEKEVKAKLEQLGNENIISFMDDIFTAATVRSSTFENEAYFDCEYQDSLDFSIKTPLVKPIAFYLPQFHEIPENNEWWGEGFTEWTNTKKAKPHFKGHYQPREPHDDIGYYDLSDVETIRKQAEIAKRHGIYGWSIYYYWFSGKTLLTKPLDIILENKDIDINFCLTWANEDWTKAWVGDSKTTLLENKYLPTDPADFIDEIAKYMRDERYIRVDGKPLLVIYRCYLIPNAKKIISLMRKRAIENGLGELHIISAIRPHTIDSSGLVDSFDGETMFCQDIFRRYALKLLDKNDTILSNSLCSFKDCIEHYKKAIERGEFKDAYLSTTCGWDNSPRYEKLFSIYDLGFSLKDFYDLNKYIVDDALENDKEFIFVFAWNEWAEGAYLEPDKRFGYALINTLSKAVHGVDFKMKEGLQ